MGDGDYSRAAKAQISWRAWPSDENGVSSDTRQAICRANLPRGPEAAVEALDGAVRHRLSPSRDHASHDPAGQRDAMQCHSIPVRRHQDRIAIEVNSVPPVGRFALQIACRAVVVRNQHRPPRPQGPLPTAPAAHSKPFPEMETPQLRAPRDIARNALPGNGTLAHAVRCTGLGHRLPPDAGSAHYLPRHLPGSRCPLPGGETRRGSRLVHRLLQLSMRSSSISSDVTRARPSTSPVAKMIRSNGSRWGRHNRPAYRRNPVRDPRRPSEEPDWGPHALAVRGASSLAA